MIPAIILSANIVQTEVDEASIVVKQFSDGSILDNLKNAIEWALENDEDVIYCIATETIKRIADIPNLEETLFELLEQHIYMYYVDTDCNEEILIDARIAMLSHIKVIKSFIITKPIYRFLLSALTVDDMIEPSMERLFNLLFLYPISIHPDTIFSSPLSESHIRVIAPFRNVANYIDDFLTSLENQQYSNYTVYFIDDCSDDGTINMIPNNSRYNIKVNEHRKYALENIVSVLEENDMEENDIICIIDPDDCLAHKYVFQILNNAHCLKSVLMTYGSMGYLNSRKRFGKSYNEEEFKVARQLTWWVSQLRTFKFKVFIELLKQDVNKDTFLDNDGNYLKMPYDMALMFPMMEICGYEHVKFIDVILYQYRLHENNDQFSNRDEQYRGEIIIRNKPKLNKVW
ncbi:glycosyltransferase family A protein [Sphingobacterium faecium]|uniref:glycosyltransferase family A protein n=1 Tax=Sphingobacterium faecium TaxID=34087 RepID=UPI0024794179|nr:glycosyltransferase family A protein [Sphingobacterium faecium]WGQ14993.1 glycosyltransferase family A protein [Sphingobacterium faecium]